MSDRLVTHRVDDRWCVFRLGEFARVVASFPTLREAEAYIIEYGDPHEIEPGEADDREASGGGGEKRAPERPADVATSPGSATAEHDAPHEVES